MIESRPTPGVEAENRASVGTFLQASILDTTVNFKSIITAKHILHRAIQKRARLDPANAAARASGYEPLATPRRVDDFAHCGVVQAKMLTDLRERIAILHVCSQNDLIANRTVLACGRLEH